MSEKNIRVLALDLDGTLTNDEKKVTPRTRAALALPDDAAAVRCTPMEQPLPGEEAVPHSLPLTLHPFEICTIHVQFAQ